MTSLGSSEGARLDTGRPVTTNAAAAKLRDSESSYGPLRRQAWITALIGAHTDAALPTPVYATLVALARHMAADGTVRCSLQELAGRSPRVRRTLQRHLATAMAAGWLTRVSGGRGGPGGEVSTYQASRPGQDHSEATFLSSHSAIVRRHPPAPHSAHSEATLVVTVKREDPSGSEDGARERAAADDPTTAQPRPTATGKGAHNGEGQPGSRSTPEPLAADVALATAKPPARRSTPEPLEVRPCVYCGQTFAPDRSTQIAHTGRCPVPVKVTTKNAADRERPNDPDGTAPSLAVVLAFGPAAERRECLACIWGQGQHATYCAAVA